MRRSTVVSSDGTITVETFAATAPANAHPPAASAPHPYAASAHALDTSHPNAASSTIPWVVQQPALPNAASAQPPAGRGTVASRAHHGAFDRAIARASMALAVQTPPPARRLDACLQHNPLPQWAPLEVSRPQWAPLEVSMALAVQTPPPHAASAAITPIAASRRRRGPPPPPNAAHRRHRWFSN